MNGWGAAAGAIVSTAGDLARWDAALIGGKLLSADDLATMLRPGTLPVYGPKSQYGYGWIVDAYEGQSRVWHNGQTLGFHASNQIYPGLSETIVVLANKRSDTDAVANVIFNALHPALAAAAAKPAAGEDPKVTARVKRVWDALLSGTLDRSELSDRVNAELTPAVVARASKELKAMGAPPAWTYTGSTATSTMRSYHYRLGFSTGTTMRVTMSVGAGGKITDFAIDPDN